MSILIAFCRQMQSLVQEQLNFLIKLMPILRIVQNIRLLTYTAYCNNYNINTVDVPTATRIWKCGMPYINQSKFPTNLHIIHSYISTTLPLYLIRTYKLKYFPGFIAIILCSHLYKVRKKRFSDLVT